MFSSFSQILDGRKTQETVGFASFTPSKVQYHYVSLSKTRGESRIPAIALGGKLLHGAPGSELAFCAEFEI
jgi:hypothetical protein